MLGVLHMPEKKCVFPAIFAVFLLRSTSAFAIVPFGPSFSFKNRGFSLAGGLDFFEELHKLAVKEAKGSAGKFVIPGIGRVVKAHRKARIGRNPQTGEQIKIKAKTVVRLRPAKALKDAVLK